MQSLMIFLFLITFFGILGMILACVPFKKIYTGLLRFKHIKNIAILSNTNKKREALELQEKDLFKLNLDTHFAQHFSPASKTSNTKAQFTVLYLIAPANMPYQGDMIWRILLEKKLIYGAMQIFHAYNSKRTGNILFSVAGATEPGYLDKESLAENTLSGLCFFMHHQAAPHALENFENMLKTAQQIQEALGGTLCDHHQQPLTEKTIHQYQQKLSSLFL